MSVTCGLWGCPLSRMHTGPCCVTLEGERGRERKKPQKLLEAGAASRNTIQFKAKRPFTARRPSLTTEEAVAPPPVNLAPLPALAKMSNSLWLERAHEPRAAHLVNLGDALPLALRGLTHRELACARSVCTALREAVHDVWASTTHATTFATTHATARATTRAGIEDLCVEVAEDAPRALHLGVGGLRLKPACWEDRFQQLCSLGSDATLAERLLPRLLHPLRGLRSLTLSHLRGLNVIAARTIACHVPGLVELDVSGSTIGSDACDAFSALRSLESLDLTFCGMVSYASVMRLRAACPKLQLIRRQPSWLDGTLITPWGEEHTYYP